MAPLLRFEKSFFKPKFMVTRFSYIISRQECRPFVYMHSHEQGSANQFIYPTQTVNYLKAKKVSFSVFE